MRKLMKPFLIIHKVGLKMGIQILPNHYYSSVADINHLKKTKKIWAKKSTMPEIKLDLDEQIKNLKTICSPYKNEYLGNKIYKKAVSLHFGPGFGYIEAQALHSVIRHYKPKKIIEIGSGVSTYCSVTAVKMNTKELHQNSDIICIDPFPSAQLQMIKNITLIKKEVQTIPIKLFTDLNSNDILFIDSSHTVKPSSDVNYIILEILPRLHKGVIVHFHDIYFPYDYQRGILNSFFQWSESSLLRAFLISNYKVEIIFCLSILHYDRKSDLKEVFPEYNPSLDKNGLTDEIYEPFKEKSQHFPSSIYFQIRG